MSGITVTADEYIVSTERLRVDGGVPWFNCPNARAASAAALNNAEKALPLKCKNEAWRDNTRSNLPKTGTGRGGGWKATKQLAQLEQSQLTAQTPCYSSIQAGESTRVPPRACDITGVPAALYADKRSRLRYAHSSLHEHVKAMPDHLAERYLDLRNAGKLIK